MVVPSESDFSYAVERWRITSDGDRTRITYQSEVVPKFAVPPIIGPWSIRIAMRRELEQSVIRLQQIAR